VPFGFISSSLLARTLDGRLSVRLQLENFESSRNMQNCSSTMRITLNDTDHPRDDVQLEIASHFLRYLRGYCLGDAAIFCSIVIAEESDENNEISGGEGFSSPRLVLISRRSGDFPRLPLAMYSRARES